MFTLTTTLTALTSNRERKKRQEARNEYTWCVLTQPACKPIEHWERLTFSISTWMAMPSKGSFLCIGKWKQNSFRIEFVSFLIICTNLPSVCLFARLYIIEFSLIFAFLITRYLPSSVRLLCDLLFARQFIHRPPTQFFTLFHPPIRPGEKSFWAKQYISECKHHVMRKISSIFGKDNFFLYICWIFQNERK